MLKSVSSSGTGGLKFLKTWISSLRQYFGPPNGPRLSGHNRLGRPKYFRKDEIQVYKNLRQPVPKELTLFNVLKQVLVTSDGNCFNIWQDRVKDFRNYKISLKWWQIKKSFVISNYKTRQVRESNLKNIIFLHRWEDFS